jgi:hypothetical protein
VYFFLLVVVISINKLSCNLGFILNDGCFIYTTASLVRVVWCLVAVWNIISVSWVRFFLVNVSLILSVFWIICSIRICKVQYAGTVVYLRRHWNYIFWRRLATKTNKLSISIVKVIDFCLSARENFAYCSPIALVRNKGELVNEIWRVFCGDLLDVIRCVIHLDISACAFKRANCNWVFDLNVSWIVNKS